ncbi:hypothetical protein DICPUDRAFT_52910 [Dictyostelium purpureum]|uniref:Nucleoporin n=1 Tax=Dictyostelium purpureum TaxID=5786 RepID=F0ZAH9_DICPU|nr:uncharacterized protein DICPUDRAFT_52910 [Dictyostelium purpureum]EGC39051.1 hypothetical protein DICPUDRAFT_52910 [Dictyostelium purpureum]|eukprot:XP_003284401.1 hypothetical protein DICPUDRAFT_52910 [Dictyostelium purpureum]
MSLPSPSDIIANTTTNTTTTSTPSTSSTSPSTSNTNNDSGLLSTADLTSSRTPTNFKQKAQRNVTDSFSTFLHFFNGELLSVGDMELEFRKIEDKLKINLDDYLGPNNASKEQISSGKFKIKGEEYVITKEIQNFTLELSSLLNLNELSTFILIIKYIENIKPLEFDKSELVDLFDYYYTERGSLLQILGEIVTKVFANSEYSTFLTDFIRQNSDTIETSLLSHLIPLYNFSIPLNLKELQQFYCLKTIKEQLSIVETLFLYNYFKMKYEENNNTIRTKHLLTILKKINELQIGVHSDQLIYILNSTFSSKNSEPIQLLKRIEYVSVMLVFCNNKFKYSQESLQQSEQEILNTLKSLSQSIHFNSPLATCLLFTIINLFLSSITHNFEQINRSLQPLFQKAQIFDPVEYLSNCLLTGFNDSAYLAGYCDCINIFLNRLCELSNLSDMDSERCNGIIDIYCLTLEKGGKGLLETFWANRGNDPIYQFCKTEESLSRDSSKIISILKSVIVDERSSGLVFSELSEIRIFGNRVVISRNDFDRMKNWMEGENWENNRVAVSIKRAFQAPIKLYKEQNKSFIMKGDGTVEVFDSLHDSILDLIADSSYTQAQYIQQQTMYFDQESFKAYIVVLDLISKFVKFSPNISTYFWKIFQENQILQSIIQVYSRSCNQQNYNASLSQSTSLSNSYGLNRSINRDVIVVANSSMLFTDVLKSILSLFTAFSQNTPIPILNLLVEKGIWSSNPADMVSLFKKGSFTYLYEEEKRTSSTIKASSSAPSATSSQPSSFALTKSIVRLFNTFINQLNGLEDVLDRQLYLLYLESFITFHLQVISDYFILSGNNNHLEAWEMIGEIFLALEKILYRSQCHNSILKPLAFKIINSFSSGNLQCVLKTLLEIETLQITNKGDRTASIDSILYSSLSFSKAILSTIYLSFLFDKKKYDQDDMNEEVAYKSQHLERNSLGLTKQFLDTFFIIKQSEVGYADVDGSGKGRADLNNLFIIIFNYINSMPDNEEIQILSCEILSSIVRILRVLESTFSISTLFSTDEQFSLMIENFTKQFIISNNESIDVWSPRLKTYTLRLLLESSTSQVTFINRILSATPTSQKDQPTSPESKKSFITQLLLNNKSTIKENNELSLSLLQFINNIYLNSVYYDSFIDFKLNNNQEFWSLLLEIQKGFNQDNAQLSIEQIVYRTLKISCSIEILSLSVLLSTNHSNNLVSSAITMTKWHEMYRNGKELEKMINGFFDYVDIEKVSPPEKIRDHWTTHHLPPPEKLQKFVENGLFPNTNNSTPLVELFNIDNIVDSYNFDMSQPAQAQYISLLNNHNRFQLLSTSCLCLSRSFSKFFRVVLQKEPQYFIECETDEKASNSLLPLLNILVDKAMGMTGNAIQTLVTRNDLLTFLAESILTVSHQWCKYSPEKLVNTDVLRKLSVLLSQTSIDSLDPTICYLVLSSILVLVENSPQQSIQINVFNELINILSSFIGNPKSRTVPNNGNGASGVDPNGDNNGINGDILGNSKIDSDSKHTNKKPLPSICNLSITILQVLIDRLDENSLIAAFPNHLLENLCNLLESSLNLSNNNQQQVDYRISTAILNLLIGLCKQPLIAESILEHRFIWLLCSNSLKFLENSKDPYLQQFEDSGLTYQPSQYQNYGSSSTYKQLLSNQFDQKKNKWHKVWTLVVKFMINISKPLDRSERFIEQLSNFIFSHKERLFYYFDDLSRSNQFGQTQQPQFYSKLWFEQIEYTTTLFSIFSKYTKRYYLQMGIFKQFLSISYRLMVSISNQCSELSFIENNFRPKTKNEKHINSIQIKEFLEQQQQYEQQYQSSQQQQQSTGSQSLGSPYKLSTSASQKQKLQQQQHQQNYSNSIFKFIIESLYINILNNCFTILLNVNEYVDKSEFIPQLTFYPDVASFGTFGHISNYILTKYNQFNLIYKLNINNNNLNNINNNSLNNLNNINDQSISINNIVDLNIFKAKVRQTAEKDALLYILYFKQLLPSSTSQQEQTKESQITSAISSLLNQFSLKSLTPSKSSSTTPIKSKINNYDDGSTNLNEEYDDFFNFLQVLLNSK